MGVVGALVVCVLSTVLIEGGSTSQRAGDELQVKLEDPSPNDSALKKLFPVLKKGAKVKRETDHVTAAVSGNGTLLQCGNSTAKCSLVNKTRNNQNSAADQLVGLEPAQREVASNFWPQPWHPCEFPVRRYFEPCEFPTRRPIGPMTFPTQPPTEPVTLPTPLPTEPVTLQTPLPTEPIRVLTWHPHHYGPGTLPEWQ